MQNETQDEVILRALGQLENYAWLIDPITQKYFTVTAEVTGKNSVNSWATALHAAQEKRPLIHSHVNTDDLRPLHFIDDPSAKIPLRVVRLDKVTDVEQEIKCGSEGEQTTGVATLHNAIHLIHTSY
ncbi:hypothetical protein [Serratia fonticola]